LIKPGQRPPYLMQADGTRNAPEAQNDKNNANMHMDTNGKAV